jgi:hypothetical protein
MAFLSTLFVGQPLHILAVGFAGLVLHSALTSVGRMPPRRTRPLLIATITWLLYGLWEWAVLSVSPEANIRVDLLVIWPLLALVSGYGALCLLR